MIDLEDLTQIFVGQLSSEVLCKHEVFCCEMVFKKPENSF